MPSSVMPTGVPATVAPVTSTLVRLGRRLVVGDAHGHLGGDLADAHAGRRGGGCRSPSVVATDSRVVASETLGVWRWCGSCRSRTPGGGRPCRPGCRRRPSADEPSSAASVLRRPAPRPASGASCTSSSGVLRVLGAGRRPGSRGGPTRRARADSVPGSVRMRSPGSGRAASAVGAAHAEVRLGGDRRQADEVLDGEEAHEVEVDRHAVGQRAQARRSRSPAPCRPGRRPVAGAAGTAARGERRGRDDGDARRPRLSRGSPGSGARTSRRRTG